MPESASAPENAIDTGARNQPRESGGRSGAAPVTDGAVESILTVRPSVLVPPALEARHSRLTPDVSSLTVCASQPDVVHGDSGSVTVQWTLSAPRYQPSSPPSPLTVRVIT